MLNKKVVKIVGLVIGFCVPYAFGADLGSVASTVTGTLVSVMKLVTAGAYVAGFGLTVAALFKFKAHKENPQQAPLGTCIALLLVGICLIFLPSIVNIGGGTLGASNQGGVGGFNSV